MDSRPKTVEVTSNDWATLAAKLEQFSSSLGDEEQALLQGIIALAEAELDTLGEEANEHSQEFAERLRPGVNINNTRSLAAHFKSSFSKFTPNVSGSLGGGTKDGSASSTIFIQ